MQNLALFSVFFLCRLSSSLSRLCGQQPPHTNYGDISAISMFCSLISLFLFRFYVLRSLNLADNDLRCFPMALCKMKLLTELNLASNKIEDIPPDIMDLEK